MEIKITNLENQITEKDSQLAEIQAQNKKSTKKLETVKNMVLDK